MAKLTKRERIELQEIARLIETGLAYLNKPTVAICRKGGPATTTLHYTRADGSTLYEVTKEYGSDFVQISSALRRLQLFTDNA